MMRILVNLYEELKNNQTFLNYYNVYTVKTCSKRLCWFRASW